MGEHGTKGYIKIYLILLALFVVSVLGPELGIKTVTLITAFGIAIVKAFLVCAHFMHLNVEKRYIWYMLLTCLALMFMFFTALVPDILSHSGHNWESKLEFVDFNTHGHHDDAHGTDHGETHSDESDHSGHSHDAHGHDAHSHDNGPADDHSSSTDDLSDSVAPAAG
jgi:caa(3)-type oxidase subunit IV